MDVTFELQDLSNGKLRLFAGLQRLILGDLAARSGRYQVFVRVVLSEREKAIMQKYRLDQLVVWKGPQVLNNDKGGRTLCSFPFLIVAAQLLEEQPLLLLRASTRCEAEEAIRAFSAGLRTHRLRIMDFDYDAVLTPIHPEPTDLCLQFSI